MFARYIGIVSVTFLTLGGCATNASKPVSEAKQITDAGGYELKDVSRERLDKAARDSGSTMRNATSTGLSAAGYLRPPPGFSQGATTGIFALALVGDVFGTKKETLSRLFAWMPKELASNQKEAADRMASIVKDAVSNSLPGHQVVVGSGIVEGWSKQNLQVKITGPLCAKECLMDIAGFTKPYEGKAPLFLGSYAAYTWASGGFKGNPGWWRRGWPNDANNMTSEQKLEFYQKLSANLPNWAYIYIAPYEQVVSYPVVYHQGEPLLFIEPEPNKASEKIATRQ